MRDQNIPVKTGIHFFEENVTWPGVKSIVFALILSNYSTKNNFTVNIKDMQR